MAQGVDGALGEDQALVARVHRREPEAFCATWVEGGGVAILDLEAAGSGLIDVREDGIGSSIDQDLPGEPGTGEQGPRNPSLRF